MIFHCFKTIIQNVRISFNIRIFLVWFSMWVCYKRFLAAVAVTAFELIYYVIRFGCREVSVSGSRLGLLIEIECRSIVCVLFIIFENNSPWHHNLFNCCISCSFQGFVQNLCRWMYTGLATTTNKTFCRISNVKFNEMRWNFETNWSTEYKMLLATECGE